MSDDAALAPPEPPFARRARPLLELQRISKPRVEWPPGTKFESSAAMPEARTRCALALIDDDERSVQLLARLSHDDSYAVAMTVGAAAGARRRTLRMLARLLRSDGYVIDTSIGDWAALERLTRVPRPHVMVIDVDAEPEAAMNLVRHARAVLPALGIVLVTDRADVLEAAAAGVVPRPVILEKPIEYADLRARVWEVAEYRTKSAIVAIGGAAPARRRSGYRR